MAHNHLHIDPALPLVRQADKGHNRWHPDIAPAVRIAADSSVEMETLDGLDGQIRPGTTAADLAGIEMGRVHPLTGPVHVDGAEPGDLLAVKIEQIVPANRGFTMIMPGFGFLRDLFTTPFLVHWEMANGFAVSPQLPGVRIPGAPFMGVMGVAPSHELLQRIVAREANLAARGGMVMPPDAAGAVPTAEPIASRAFRTIAPHETGGNSTSSRSPPAPRFIFRCRCLARCSPSAMRTSRRATVNRAVPRSKRQRPSSPVSTC